MGNEATLPSLSLPQDSTRIFLWIHRCTNTCNRSRLLFLSARSRRPSNLHILYRADCPPYCVQPTAELLHIEHKLALLHDNENTNGVDEHVRTRFDKFEEKFFFFFSKNTIISYYHFQRSSSLSTPRILIKDNRSNYVETSFRKTWIGKFTKYL